MKTKKGLPKKPPLTLGELAKHPERIQELIHPDWKLSSPVSIGKSLHPGEFNDDRFDVVGVGKRTRAV